MIKWCHNSKTGEIFSYSVEGGMTDFSRGTLMAYGDYLTTNFDSEGEAKEWASKWGYCGTCRGSCTADKDGKCRHCGSEVVFMPIKVNK